MTNDNLKSITNRLWAMANELRGNMDAGEFKNYILAFMFYRYLSEHQVEYLSSCNVNMIKEGETVKGSSYLDEIVAEDLEEYLADISSSLGYAIAPSDMWEVLVEKINNNSIIPSDYETIFNNFNVNSQRNNEALENFEGVFSDINLGDSRLGSSTTTRVKSLNNIVKLVDSIDYKGENGKDVLGEIYEYLIGKFAATAGKKGGEFYTPHQVSIVLAKIVTTNLGNLNIDFSVYDPTMGSGSLLLTVRNELDKNNKADTIHFYGQELNTTTYNLARMNMMMHGVSYVNMNLKNSDTLEVGWTDRVDGFGDNKPRSFAAVVANPPYSAKWDNNNTKLEDPRFREYGKLAPAGKADFAFILHGIYHLNEQGTMVIVLPHGVLFRGAAEGIIRTALIKKNYLDTVIGLPANLFYGTTIPTTILVFKKKRENEDILFIDASKEFTKGKNKNNLSEDNIEKIITTFRDRKTIDKYSRVVSINEIRENNFNLNIPRYVDTHEEEELIDLDEINKLIAQDNAEIAELEKQIAEQLRILGVKI